MYQFISLGLTGFLLKTGVIQKDKAEIYAFGFESMVSRLGTILFLQLTGLLLQAVVEAVVYYLAFLLLRKYAGGYHATTYVRCNTLYLSGFVLLVALSRLAFYGNVGQWVAIGLVCYTLFTVWRLAPIENPNNPIVKGKESAYRRYALLMAGGLGLLVIALLLLEFPIYAMLSLTLGLGATYMYVEIIKNKKGGYLQ